MLRAVLIATAVVSLPCWAAAQTDFTSTTLKPGDFIYVTTASGDKESGRITEVAARTLTLNGIEFKPEPRLLIERRGDSVKDGALKGLLIGSVLTAVIAASNGTDMNDIPATVLYFAPPHAFWGAMIDWFHTGRTSVFRGSTAEPEAAARPLLLELTFDF
jgi:hypothetical protein